MSKNIRRGDSLRCGFNFWLFCQSWCCRLPRLLVLLRLLQTITTHILLHLAKQISRLGPMHSTWYVTNSSLLSYRPLCAYGARWKKTQSFEYSNNKHCFRLKLPRYLAVRLWMAHAHTHWCVVAQMQFISIPV